MAKMKETEKTSSSSPGFRQTTDVQEKTTLSEQPSVPPHSHVVSFNLHHHI